MVFCIIPLRTCPTGIPKKVVGVLCLFCSVYIFTTSHHDIEANVVIIITMHLLSVIYIYIIYKVACCEAATNKIN